MAVNLVGMVMQYLIPDRIGRIAAAFNLDTKTVQSVAEISVPSLLAGLAGIGWQPGGAQKLVDAVRQHAGALDSRSRAIGGNANQAMLADKGTQWLSSLFGDQNQVALVGAVTKFCGLSPGASEALLGLLFPVVLGTISKQLGGSSLNAPRLTNLLAAQRENIAAALPSGFADLLRGTGLLAALGSGADKVSSATNQTSSAAASATNGTPGLLRPLPIEPQGRLQPPRGVQVTQERARIRYQLVRLSTGYIGSFLLSSWPLSLLGFLPATVQSRSAGR